METTRGTGTQAIERAARVLRVLAERAKNGWRISDVAARTHLPLGTCHRLLDGLVRERLAVHLPNGSRYAVGPLVAELAAARPGWMDLPGDAAPALRQLARRHRAVAFLYARSGADFVCLVREEGIAMRALAIERGTRRPLSTSAGGAAILVQLPGEERREIVRANMAELTAFDELRISGIRAMLRESIECGFGLNLARVVAGVHAFGVVVLDAASGSPLGAVGLSGPPERLPLARIEAMLPEVQRVAQEIALLWMGTREG